MATLTCSSSELNLDVVLSNGQSFRWKNDGIYWVGVARHRLWRIWRPSKEQIQFQVLHRFVSPTKAEEEEEVANILKQYFQLDVELAALYHLWASRDAHFAKVLTAPENLFQGIRILDQDPVECLFAFICSVNNNIPRISKMVEKLCELYGTQTQLAEYGIIYDFPTIGQMSAHLPDMERTLREAGFGYRAASIARTVRQLSSMKNPELWLNSLRELPYAEARTQLMGLPGVGPKVADCICLMALGRHEVVPVDRHVFNLTAQIYRPEFLKSKNGAKSVTISKAVHAQIGRFYIDLHGPYAGWAHSILFSTRLKRFATK